MTYSLHRGAELDPAEAARFYRREGGRAVAARFLDEFERIAELLVENPGIGTPTDDERRWFPLTLQAHSSLEIRPSFRLIPRWTRLVVACSWHRWYAILHDTAFGH